MTFTIYGQPHQSISFDDLLAIQKEHGMLWAHAEDSGSESCYCEVARWNEKARRWERFCHLKCMDYRLPELLDASDEQTAIKLAERINALLHCGDRASIVHSMPNYVEQK
jgi:hypothetical protein